MSRIFDVRKLVCACLILSAMGPAQAELTISERPKSQAPLTFEFIDKALFEGRLADAKLLIINAPEAVRGADLDLRHAQWFLASGNYEQAIAAFQKIEDNPSIRPAVLTGRASALFHMGKLQQADELLDQSLALDPAQARAWITKAVMADRALQWDMADQAYAKALELDPKQATYWYNRGYSRLLQRSYSKAEGDFQKALDLDPDLEIARLHHGLARALQGDYAAFEQRGEVSNAVDLNLLGYAALVRNELDLAEQYFAQAIEASVGPYRAAEANLAYVLALKASGMSK